ncbi:MAG: hypothetical protein LC733_01155, partial [Actinobacteria bacterium]|nr:hypothetical protein [Actinomycetota bacterium]
VFVALDCALVEPELPEEATGLATTVAVPPLPPLALPTATLDPPVALDEPEPPVAVLLAEPPEPAEGVAVPPLPPLPPAATTTTVFVALPVEPDVDVEFAPAPELAALLALPMAVAAPVEPELPELPEVACAVAAVAPARSRTTAVNTPPSAVRPIRTSVR